MALLIKSNHNIDFIPSNIEALDFVYYITNYAIKKNYSQYQYIIYIAFIQNAYNQVMQQYNN